MRSLHACLLAIVAGFVLPGCPSNLRPTPSPSIVSLQVKAPADGGSGWRALAPGDTLRSGDRFSMRIEVDADVYLYVAQRSSGGGIVTILPAAGAQPERARAGQVTQLPPADGAWFSLDNQPGEEDLFVVASRTPLRPQQVRQVMEDAPKDRGDPPPTVDGKNKRDPVPADPPPIMNGGTKLDDTTTRGYDRRHQKLIKPLDRAGTCVLRFWLRHQ